MKNYFVSSSDNREEFVFLFMGAFLQLVLMFLDPSEIWRGLVTIFAIGGIISYSTTKKNSNSLLAALSILFVCGNFFLVDFFVIPPKEHLLFFGGLGFMLLGLSFFFYCIKDNCIGVKTRFNRVYYNVLPSGIIGIKWPWTKIYEFPTDNVIISGSLTIDSQKYDYQGTYRFISTNVPYVLMHYGFHYETSFKNKIKTILSRLVKEAPNLKTANKAFTDIMSAEFRTYLEIEKFELKKTN